ncbi:IS4 family transposase [Streptomyces chartreusis]
MVEGLGLGDLTEVFPAGLVDMVIGKAGVQERRRRLLPARLMVYFMLGRALFCPDPYREVLRKLAHPLRSVAGWDGWRVPDKAAVFRARLRLGEEPLKELLAQVGPVADEATPGSFWRGLRLMVVDGTVLETADTQANAAFFGRPRNRPGQTVAYPQLRVAALIESGTHVIVDAEIGTYHTGEVELSQRLVRSLRPGMLLLADRGFPGVRWWKHMSDTGVELLCRVQKGWKLLPEQILEDGSWISTVRIRVQKGTPKTGRDSVTVRVIEYRLDDTGRDPGRHYRLVTTLLDPRRAPAAELAALYAERWEAENTFAELKTSQIGHDRPLPSKSPELVRQELWAHLAEVSP